MDEIGEVLFDKNWSGHAMYIYIYLFNYIYLFLHIYHIIFF